MNLCGDLLTFGPVLGFPGQYALSQQPPVLLKQIVSAENLAVARSAVGFGFKLSGNLPQLLVLMDLRVHSGDRVFDALLSIYKIFMLLCAL